MRCYFVLYFMSMACLFVSCDTERKDAIQYLVKNKTGHFTEVGTAVDLFLQHVYAEEEPLSSAQLSQIWQDVSVDDKSCKIADSGNISNSLLEANVDEAIGVWRSVPWKDSVNFETFCKYILPYRVMSETVKAGWRDTLYNCYHPLIVGVKDMKKAFEIVHDSIQKCFRQTDIKMPYILSVIDLNRILCGSCAQRCVYEVAVMRSLGIPVAFDGLHEWANYSSSRHTWVSLISHNGTYTVARKDSVARRYNPIDASTFDLKIPLEDNYDTAIDDILQFKKTSARVVLYCYDHQQNNFDDDNVDADTRGRFTYPFLKDVSEEYFKTSDIEIKSRHKYGYLCVYKTGWDWEPVVYSKLDNGYHTFSNMGDSVVYLYGIFRQGKFVPQGHPFIFADGRVLTLSPSKETIELKATRKYPMITQFVNYWTRARNAYFAASNDSTFKDSVLLHYITRTPSFRNTVKVNPPKKYRYYRYGTHVGMRHNLAEIRFYDSGKPLRGFITSCGVQDAERGFDDDTFSFFEGKSPFWINIDFGEPVRVDKIVYFVRNDDNYVVPDNDYELFYYDHGWRSLGVRHSTGYEVKYDNVPANALYLLKNLSNGREERVFTYENGKQKWW